MADNEIAAPVAPHVELERRLEVAEALAELALARVAEACGVPTEQDYLNEFRTVEEQFHLTYGPEEA
jgi:hypothetical protein